MAELKYDKYVLQYSINRYFCEEGKERVEHVLILGKREFKGISLDDVVNKFKLSLGAK